MEIGHDMPDFIEVNMPRDFKPVNDGQFKIARFGKDHDGGYWMPVFVNPPKLLISGGIFDDWSFESEMQKMYDLKIIAFDGSVDYRMWIVKILKAIPRLYDINQWAYFFKPFLFRLFFSGKKNEFYKKFIGMPQDGFITVDDISDRSEGFEPVILKMDIEGGEYRVLHDFFKKIPNICCAVVEFHDFDLHYIAIKQILDEFDLQVITLNCNNFGCIGLKNIPSVVEMVVIRSDTLIKHAEFNESENYQNLFRSRNNAARLQFKMNFV